MCTALRTHHYIPTQWSARLSRNRTRVGPTKFSSSVTLLLVLVEMFHHHYISDMFAGHVCMYVLKKKSVSYSVSCKKIIIFLTFIYIEL